MPRPSETPAPSPSPTSTPLPEPDPAVVLRVAVFRDDDADALKGSGEPGLAGTHVLAQSEAWSETFAVDAVGVATITLPGPDAYLVGLAGDAPGAGWEATTRTAMRVQVEPDGEILFLLPDEEDNRPIGVAEGVAFAFGLVRPSAPAVPWPALLLSRIVLVWLARSTARVRIAVAIRERAGVAKKLSDLEAAIGGSKSTNLESANLPSPLGGSEE
jgi:hypothetical protein